MSEGQPRLRALREVAPAEHKFFELHARSALVDGLYASLVVLVEGPTERGAFPVLWAAHSPGDGLDEHRIEIVDCESVNKMPSFVRFYRALEVPVVAVVDMDKPDAVKEVEEAEPEALLRWSSHGDWEGLLAAEADVAELAAAMEECRASLGTWDEHASQLRSCLIAQVGASEHLASASDIRELLAGYEEPRARVAAAALLRGRGGIDFKSPLYARTICAGLNTVPPTMRATIDHVHRFADGNPTAAGVHDL